MLWRLVALLVAPPELKELSENQNTRPELVEGRSSTWEATPPSTSSGGVPRSFRVGSKYSWKSLGSALALGCLLGLALLSKLSALALVALTGLTLLLAAWRARVGGR